MATRKRRKRPTCRAELMSDNVALSYGYHIYSHFLLLQDRQSRVPLDTDIRVKNECIMIHNDGSDRLVSGESILYAKSATLMVAQAS